MRILLVGEASIAARMAEKLSPYGTVETTTAQHFHGVPQGTEWVLIMAAGQYATRILSAAAQAKAKAVSIPTGWTHAEAKLARAGFFTRREDVPASPLTQRPFAHVADALASQREREREEAARKAAAATERGMNPPPLTEEEEEALTAPDPLPPAPEEPAVEVVPAMAPPPLAPPTSASESVAKPTQRRVYGNVVEKEARLRQLFEWNPDLALADAQAMLAAVASDGRALNWTMMSEIRRQVRAAKGLPTDVRRFNQIEKRLSPMNGEYAFTPREDSDPGVPASAPTPLPAPPAAPPAATGYALPLPGAVDAASRLLGEELERAPEVESFTLTFRRGERPKVRWRPNVEGSVEL